MVRGYWDIHNHILPGVDDGSSCVEETMALLKTEYEQGIRNIVFTPHYRPRMFEVSADDRESVYHKVVAQAEDFFPDMSFYLGCEYFVNSRMMRDLQDPRCRMAGTRIVLLEFSTVTPYHDIQNAVKAVTGAGYRVVIAHPERYQCLHADVARIARLRQQQGVWLQINAGSVIGKSGRMLKHFCHDLLKEDMVDFIASDAHSTEHRPVEMERCLKFVQKKFSRGKAERLFRENQNHLFA
ncbi:MAG: capsular biosynthesis protein [Lachnospiraceae bacterium]|nr:capsular biosynthesis protein [Lachnospiraceae bacterium]